MTAPEQFPREVPAVDSNGAMTPETRRYLFYRKHPDQAPSANYSDETTRPQPACQGYDIDIFFTPGDMKWESPAARKRLVIARAICNSCPIKAKCLDDALECDDQYAFLGAKTPKERNAIVRNARRL